MTPDLPLLYTAALDSLSALAQRLHYTGRVADALAAVDHALALAGEELSPAARARLLLQRGQLLITGGFASAAQAAQTLDVAEQVLALAQGAGRDAVALRSRALDLTGQVHYHRELVQVHGDYRQAEDCFAQAYALAEAAADKAALTPAAFHLGLVAQQRGEMKLAGERLAVALALAEETADLRLKSYIVRHLGFVAQHDGDLAHARRLLAESLALREAIGYRVYLAYSHLALADVCLALDDPDTAEAHNRQALALAEALDQDRARLLAHLNLGDVCQARGQRAQARAEYAEAQRLAALTGHERARRAAEAGLLATADAA
jgi:tetratricopeptide (TPR) repeat protein